MYGEKNYRIKEWDEDRLENIDNAKKEILEILKKQKVSLSKTRFLFDNIINDIEDRNPINI